MSNSRVDLSFRSGGLAMTAAAKLRSLATPVLERAIAWAGGGLDVTLVRLALATSRAKSQRVRELGQRLDYYERIAADYAAIDPAAFYEKPPPLGEVRERAVRALED